MILDNDRRQKELDEARGNYDRLRDRFEKMAFDCVPDEIEPARAIETAVRCLSSREIRARIDAQVNFDRNGCDQPTTNGLFLDMLNPTGGSWRYVRGQGLINTKTK